jgi:hypothetical protein
MQAEEQLATRTWIALLVCAIANAVVQAINLAVPDDPEGWMALVAVGGLFPVFALLGSLIAAAIFFVRWLRRGYADAVHLEGISMPYTRSQLLWAWVIPFLNLVRPYHAVKRLAEVSHPGTLAGAPGQDTGAWDRSVPLGAWWAAWIVSSFLGRASARANSPVALDVASTISTIIAAVLCILVVRGIDGRRQERLRRLLAEESASGGAPVPETSGWPTPAAEGAPGSPG